MCLTHQNVPAVLQDLIFCSACADAMHMCDLQGPDWSNASALWSPMMTYTKVNVIPNLHGINHQSFTLQPSAQSLSASCAKESCWHFAIQSTTLVETASL